MTRKNDFPGLPLLVAKVRHWFALQGWDEPWICDGGLGFGLPKEKEKLTRVVLMGNLFYEICLSRLWPDRHYQFWVLSEAHRRVLTEFFRIPESSVGVIPREQLWSVSKKQILWPQPEQAHLVAAGRISRTKEFENLLRLVSFLQIQKKIPLQLSFFGQFDGYGREDFNEGFWTPQQTKAHFAHAVKRLNWIHPPHVVSRWGALDWHRHLPKNCVGVSLGHHFKEDFSVSLAQFQSRGVPLLLSEWGTHLDISQAQRISYELCPSQKPALNRNQLGALADEILKNWGRSTQPQLNDQRPTKCLSRLEILSCIGKRAPRDHRDRYCRTWQEFSKFFGTGQGTKTRKIYHRLLSGKSN